jgi:hypothetical protein
MTYDPGSARYAALARVGRIAWCTLWIAAFVGFHVWNLAHYDPIRGYDGLDHMRVLRSYHDTGRPPAFGYGSTNPPLYYMITGALWGWKHSYKVVQAFSLLLFGANVWLLKRLLWSATRNTWMRWAALSFVAFLPVHISYAYMIFNYSLAHTLEIAAAYCLYRFCEVADVRRLIGAGVLSGLSIFTALTGLYLVPLGIFTAFAFTPRTLGRRLLATGAFVIAVGAVSVPLYFYSPRARGCFLCTVNRTQTSRPSTQIYPPRFYWNFSASALLQPYYPNHFVNGLWNLLYESAFGDYLGYLVPDRLTDWGAKDQSALVSTGRHYLDARRAHEYAAVNLLAVPVALALLLTFVRAAVKTFAWLRRLRTSPPPQSAFVLAAALLSFAQFLAYIHRYPDYVNIHAGYFLIAFLLGVVELAAAAEAGWNRAASLALTVYAAGTYWVFLLR